METADWKKVKAMVDQGAASVCAWCRRPYTAQGVIGTVLTDNQYAEIISHGICPPCKSEMMTEARTKKAGAQ